MKKVIGVGVILQTERGTFLLQERDMNAELHPGRIAPFGGGIEKDENVFQCAQREILEELDLNIDIENLETIDIFRCNHDPDVYIHFFFANNINPVNLKLNEGKSIVELSKEEALAHGNVTDFTKEVLRFV
ncbi:NUDIX hydrolase [Candidatus Kaiserbacteria bacterium]|nr:NUDIX hydrolase [Candidatus Kaiserbacteria bacterium]